MLEKLDLSIKLSKEEYKKQMIELEPKLAGLQRKCIELQIPIMICFEGYGASGKGMQISKLIHQLDPHGFQVYPIKSQTREELLRPFLWRFWNMTPDKGNMSILDGSWCRRVVKDRFDGTTSKIQLQESYESINSFEKQLTDDGNVIIKLFLAISKKEQKERFDKLQSEKETAWRVTKQDLERNKKFDEYTKLIEDMLANTNNPSSPWYVVEAEDRRHATVKIFKIVIRYLELAIKEKETKMNSPKPIPEDTVSLSSDILGKIELKDKILVRAEYKKRLKELQDKLELLHSELYRRRIPVVLGFEGWDAGGKGGAIKRLTQPLDPRGYVVIPTKAPNDIENAHHYLWRFWRKFPKAGHFAIFDRTWYGRVMVERVEHFCTDKEWKRAYQEINDMEKELADAGAIVIKFWLHIDKDEQLKRFTDRQNTPEKQWKITDEDWRNRDKWDVYQLVINDMITKTSTPYAPWVIIEGNNKAYARIKVLETVVDAIEAKLKEVKSKKK